jgi:glycosyltransferase involved in cell wall biosynthesis
VRILYLVPRYWPSIGGAQLHSRELVNRMARRHAVQVVTQFTCDRYSFAHSVASALPGRYWDGEIAVDRIGPQGAWRACLEPMSRLYGHVRPLNPPFAWLLDRAIAPQLERLVSQFRPDILHAVHIGLVYSSETACRVASRCRVPFVWTPLPHIEGRSGWGGPRFRRLYQKADALVAMTHRERQWLVTQGAEEERVHVIPVGPLISETYDGDAFRRAHGLEGTPMVLFLAQKQAYKGYKEMLQAAPLVWEQVPEARFVFVGPRTAESESVFSLHTDARIIELPAVDEVTKSSALAACDVFCMPSTQESLGVVYLEAWCFAKPVIAANIAIAQEVIDDGRNGLLVDQSPESIARATVALLQDPAAAARMGACGQHQVHARYAWEQQVETLSQVYATLIDGR